MIKLLAKWLSPEYSVRRSGEQWDVEDREGRRVDGRVFTSKGKAKEFKRELESARA